MSIIRNIIFLIVAFVTINIYGNDDMNIKTYVSTLVNESLEILNSSKVSNKDQVISQKLSENLDIEWMARFVLGRDIRELKEEDIERFVRVYEKYIVATYTRILNGYSNQRVEVNKIINKGNDTYVVGTTVTSDNNAVLDIDYMVRVIGSGRYRVFDTLTSNISLLNAQRSEFKSVIQSQGIDALIKSISDINSR